MIVVIMILIFSLLPGSIFSQLKDSLPGKQDSLGTHIPKAEILSGGFIDISPNGQMNASARLFRIYIGEPGKWQLPLSLYSGVSANNFSIDNEYEELATQLINPGTGIFSISIDGNNSLLGTRGKLTSFRLQYQAGFRFLSIYNFDLYKNTTFHSLVGGIGCMLTTGAWEKEKVNNMGIFWISLRALYSANPVQALKELIEEKVKKDMFGYSIGLGIDISQALNVRAFYFRYLNNRDIAAFIKPVLQLSFNYSMKE